MGGNVLLWEGTAGRPVLGIKPTYHSVLHRVIEGGREGGQDGAGQGRASRCEAGVKVDQKRPAIWRGLTAVITSLVAAQVAAQALACSRSALRHTSQMLPVQMCPAISCNAETNNIYNSYLN